MAVTSRNFGGFELIDGTSPDFDIEDLDNLAKVYFVRTDADGEQGYIYFNGKKYGNGSGGVVEITRFDCGEY